jgi:hypothetical protein
VNFWGSDPDEENDDCHTGWDFESREEALSFFNEPERYIFDKKHLQRLLGQPFIVFIQIDGPDIHDKRRLREDYVREDSGEWEREIAMQAGMGLGVRAYNDAMGYGED